jgi:D-alanyl-D-alanine dipeptidase
MVNGLIFLLSWLTFESLGYGNPSLSHQISHFSAESEALQLADTVLLVTAPDWESSQGKGQIYKRGPSGFMKFEGEFPLVLGRTGLAWGIGIRDYRGLRGPQKKEGDGKSPAGFFKVTQSFGQAQVGELPFVRINSEHVCVDDSKSKFYNSIIDESKVKKDWSSYERMEIPLYKHGIEVAHNLFSPEPQGGSCIFIHLWRGPFSSTAGCTAMEESNILKVLEALSADSLLIQLPEAELGQFSLSSLGL